jgi:hypothetical protein
MKRQIFTFLTVLLVFFAVSGSQAALIELMDIPEVVRPGAPGQVQFGVYLTDMGSLANIAAFNVGLSVGGAPDLEMYAGDVEGPSRSSYIFHNNSFGYTTINPDRDASRLGIMDVAADGIGEDLADPALLGLITLYWPELDPGAEVNFSLIPMQNFAVSDNPAGAVIEDLFLSGEASFRAIPLPGTIWILGGGVLALFNLRRWQSGRRLIR